MAQTFGFMLYVLGLGVVACVLGLGLESQALVLASWFMSLALSLPSVSLTPSLCIGRNYVLLGKRTRGSRRIKLTDGLLEKKNYTHLKKAAEDRSVWRTVRRDCHKPAPQAYN